MASSVCERVAKPDAPQHSAIVACAAELLAPVLKDAGVDDSHGMLHARKVLMHVEAALAAAERDIGPERQLACRLAACGQ